MEALKVSGFGFSYPKGEPLLSDISFELEERSLNLLVGTTGSGKTTLLRSIKPEIAPTGNRQGTIEVLGQDIHSLSEEASSSLVGYVAQNPDTQIVCDVVWHEIAFGLENLGIPQDSMRRRVAEVAHFFGIEPWMHQRTASLSGGQKQLVALASVLVMQPRLLLLDEPTSQLDPVAEKNFLHALFRINHELGITIMIATHAPETMVDYASSCLRIREGKIETVDLDEFRYSPYLLASLYGTPENPLPESAFSSDPDEAERSFLRGGKKRSKKEPAITIDDVYYRYAKESPWVLRGMDLVVRRGSIHALVGGNGSGKSTLLRTVAGVSKPQRGKIVNKCLAKQALLPQDPKALFVCDSVLEELQEWQKRCGYSDDDIAAITTRFELDTRLQLHPFDLSGGQQQKLALAKLLLTKPSLLLLDEPTKGLDGQAKCEIADILLTLKEEGITVLLVTHDLSFVSMIADMATMLFDGEATCTEPIRAFFSGNIFYRPNPDGFLLCWSEKEKALS